VGDKPAEGPQRRLEGPDTIAEGNAFGTVPEDPFPYVVQTALFAPANA